MEPSKEPISARCSKLNQIFFGKSNCLVNHHLASRDGLLDALVVLYDECNNSNMKQDKHIKDFVDKFRTTVTELKQLRVNISDFEVKSIIGRGHFGDVQLVREKQTDNVYAMKILRKRDTLAQENVAFYEEERDIMAKTNSVWITQLLYAFQDVHHLYLVMEFHPGGDLLSLMIRNDDILPEDMAKFYMAEMVLAIHSLHSMGYVHRDIKPDNILIDRTGHIKLADFGSAAKLASDGKVYSKIPVGTPHYIAPEVITALNAGNNRIPAYGLECDWWSLGIVAYEILCGKTPFSDDSTIITYSNIMNHKNCLKWPNNIKISSLAKEIIGDLLEDVDSRLGYEQICKHSYFNNIDFDNIRSMVPPFVPKVSGQDDTSHFEEFQKQSQIPHLDDLKTKRDFSGKNLPFIGFTFTKDLMAMNLHSMNRKSSFSQILNTDSPIIKSPQEFHEMQQKLNDSLNLDAKSKYEIDQLKKEINDSTLKFLKLQKKSEKLEEELSSSKAEVTNLKRILSLERKERLSTENQALCLMEDIKQKWKMQEEKKIEELRKELQGRIQFIEVLEKKYKDSALLLYKTQKELETQKDEVLQYKKKASDYKAKLNKLSRDSKDNVSDWQLILNRLKSDHEEEIQDMKQKLNEALQHKSSCEIQLSEYQQELQLLKQTKVEETRFVKEECNLKKQLEKSLEKCSALEKRIEDFDKQDELIKIKEAKLRDLQLQLEQESLQTQELKMKFTILEEKLNKSRAETNKQEQTFSLKEQQLLNRLKEVENELKESCEEKNKLLTELMHFKNADQEKSSNIEEMQMTMTRLEEALRILESEKESLKKEKEIASSQLTKETVRAVKEVSNDLAQEKSYLETKISKLEDQLKNSRELNMEERQKRRDLNEELRKKEKEVSELKLDLRISNRKVKTDEDQINALQAKEAELLAKLKDAETSVESLQEKEVILKETIKNLENSITDMKENLEKQQGKFEAEKHKLEERIRSLESLHEVNKELQSKLSKVEGQYEEVSKQIKNSEDQQRLLQKFKQQQEKVEEELRQEITLKQKKCDNLEMNINILKNTCITLENQANDFEALVNSYEEDLRKLKSEKDNLISEKNKNEAELDNLQKKLADVTKQREMFEKKCSELENKFEMDEAVQNVEIKTLKAQLQEQKAVIMQLNEQLNENDKQIAVLELANTNSKRKLEAVEDDNVKIKEEAASLITQIQSLRESNFKLSSGLEEAIGKCELAKNQINELENSLETTNITHEVEKIKLEATISQQTKLIDFLQAKSVGIGKKKKTFSEKFFKRLKDNVPVQQKELEMALSRERQQVQTLRTELSKAKTEINTLKGNENITEKTLVTPTTPQSRAVLSAITLSPGSNVLDSAVKSINSQKPTKQRMHHNIPHRFNVSLNMRPTKCAACLDALHFGRNVARCQECFIVAHPKCSASLPSTCGLPNELVQHFRRSLRKRNDSLFDKSTIQPQGWVKITRNGKQSWDERYLKLSGTKLLIFDKENAESEISNEELELCPNNCEVLLHSAVTPTDLMTTAKSDLPYIIKLEVQPKTTCWPGRTFYVMAPNFTEKQKWVIVLENVIKQHSKNLNKDKNSKLLDTIILEVTGDEALDVNCAMQLTDKTLLLGAEEGLYSVELFRKQYKPNSKLNGFDSVFQIGLLEELNLILLIEGDDRQLCQLELNAVRSVIEGSGNKKLISRMIENLQACHLFSTNYYANSAFLCAATSDKISIMKWSPVSKAFEMHKELMTAEPCSCIHFAKHSIIVGADKFFEIDLKNLIVEEFLDPSDNSLTYAVYGTTQLNSFPIAVLQISSSSESEEFLVCFHEFGVFVDEFGRRTREADMKWTRLPLAFAFRSPFLFVTHFNSVEVCEIPSNMKNSKYDRACLELPGPRYLGPAWADGTIYLASIHDQTCQVLSFQGNLSALQSQQDTSSCDLTASRDMAEYDTSSLGSEFSVTSSLLNFTESDNPSDSSQCSNIGPLPSSTV